jgi:hypothetical protein
MLALPLIPAEVWVPVPPTGGAARNLLFARDKDNEAGQWHGSALPATAGGD